MVTVVGDDAITDTAAAVQVQLASGAMLAGGFDLDDAVPLAVQQDKLRAKAASLVGDAVADGLWRIISELENRPAAELVEALGGRRR